MPNHLRSTSHRCAHASALTSLHPSAPTEHDQHWVMVVTSGGRQHMLTPAHMWRLDPRVLLSTHVAVSVHVQQAS